MVFFFRHIKLFLPGLCFLLFTRLEAQSLLFPGDYLFEVQRQKLALTDTTVTIHTSMQPYVYKEVPPDTFKGLKAGADPFFDKLCYENLIQLRHIDRSSGYDRKFNLDINPIINFYAGRDALDTTHGNVQTNTRGFWIKGELGKKLLFESAFIENQSYLPAYLKQYAIASEVVPGQGRWKKFKSNGFDYATAYGILHYAVSKNFSIRFGHGKQKVGYGYRSLLLSDNSFNYPYVQFTANFFKQKLQYSQTYALLMNLSTGGSKIPYGTEQIFQKKAASFQQLSWHTCKYLDVYLFQGLIWKGTDSNNVMHLNPLYVNPLILSNAAIIGFNKTNHIIMGGGFQARPLNKTFVYTQFMYDGTSDSSGVNFGCQAGLKLFDVFKIKNLFFQYEYNYTSKYAYTNFKDPGQSYSHYNQSLATPAWFPQEHVAMLSYSYKRFFVQAKQNYSCGTGRVNQNVSYFDGKIGYMVNPRYNFNISVGSSMRTYINEAISKKPQQMQIIYVSLRTSLYNLYYDF
ncbi:MAG TPA: hypothetical protein VNY73_07635 [Bacteroidia bacterium]|jgi:hypothetical protein|nr:hypothetical protein [Bacteroidia bacterium]